MAKRGPKPRSADKQAISGESRPSRMVTTLFPDHASRPDSDEIPPPKHLSSAAKRIWVDKVNRYRQRRQKVGGFESSLAQYCAIEAELNELRRQKLHPPTAMITAHRMWAAEFYDTPASQSAKPGSAGDPSNPFAALGSPPR